MPKTSNNTKAFNNWERRSRYLLKEMVKYQIYVECLEQSLQVQKLRHEIERGQDMQHENHERGGGLLRTDLRTEDDLEAELAKLIVHEGPHA
jgi:mRNA deadenylase 3'-5' endonuclease subunit Ccr4